MINFKIDFVITIYLITGKAQMQLMHLCNSLQSIIVFSNSSKRWKTYYDGMYTETKDIQTY